MDCLDEKTLSSYLDEALPEPQRQSIEKHLSECKECLDMLVVSYDAGRLRYKCPEFLKDKIKARLGLKKKKKTFELLWLWGAIVSFALSFVFRRYFMQFLVAAIILGFKWVMEGEGAKKVVMIFRGMEKGEKGVANESSRSKNRTSLDP